MHRASHRYGVPARVRQRAAALWPPPQLTGVSEHNTDWPATICAAGHRRHGAGINASAAVHDAVGDNAQILSWFAEDYQDPIKGREVIAREYRDVWIFWTGSERKSEFLQAEGFEAGVNDLPEGLYLSESISMAREGKVAQCGS